MRKLLASTLGVGAVVAPAALAAEPGIENDTDITRDPLRTANVALHPLERESLAREAREQLRAARDRAERKRARERRRALARRQRRQAAGSETATGPAVGTPPALASIAACESGGDPSAIGGGGAFRGKYQFTYETWASVGGSGDPAAAPEAEQDRRAAILYSQAGAAPWPVCGR